MENIDIEKLSIDELKETRNKLRIDIDNINAEITRRNMSKCFDFEGKYVKMYGCCEEGPVYMYVRHNFLTNNGKYNTGELQMCYQGHGFESSVSPYTDSTWFEYSWWRDEYYLCRDLENSKNNPNSYRIEEITKEEFISAFNEIYSKLLHMFFSMIDNDEKESVKENGTKK